MYAIYHHGNLGQSSPYMRSTIYTTAVDVEGYFCLCQNPLFLHSPDTNTHSHTKYQTGNKNERIKILERNKLSQLLILFIFDKPT